MNNVREKQKTKRFQGLRNLGTLMSYGMKNAKILKARKKNQEIKTTLMLVNLELGKMGYHHPLYAQRLREFDRVMIERSKAKWQTAQAMQSGDKTAWKKSSALYKSAKALSDELLHIIKSGTDEALEYDEVALTNDGTEILFADGTPLIPEINPIVVLQGSDYEMGYQYAQQLIQIFGTWVLERKTGNAYTDEQIEVMRNWEDEIKEFAPEFISFFEGWADGATDSGVRTTYYDILDMWTGHEPPSTTYLGEEGIPDLGTPLCSGLAAWGRATKDGKLVTGSSGDHDMGHTVTVVAFPETGNNFIFAPFGAAGDVPAAGPLYFFGHPGMNDKGLAYIHHGGGPKMIEPKEYWGYGVRRAISVLHILRFANSAKEAREIEMAMPIGDIGMGDPATAGGFYADSTYAYSIESRKDPVIIRESGTLGETDYLFATNSAMHPDVFIADWMQTEPDNWDWEAPGGWKPKRFKEFNLRSLENPHVLGMKWGWFNAYHRNLHAARMLERGVGNIDMDYMKMIYRNSGSIPEGDWKTVSGAYTEGAWDLSVGNSSNALVVVMNPEDGIYAHCVGAAARGLTPMSAKNSSPLFHETNAFWEIKLSDTPAEMADYARNKAEEYIAKASELLSKLPDRAVASEPLHDFLTRGREALSRGDTLRKFAESSKAEDWSRTIRAYTQAQVRALQVQQALITPPGKPEDLGL